MHRNLFKIFEIKSEWDEYKSMQVKYPKKQLSVWESSEPVVALFLPVKRSLNKKCLLNCEADHFWTHFNYQYKFVGFYMD